MLFLTRAVHFKRNSLKVLFNNGIKNFEPSVKVLSNVSLQREKHTVTYKPYVPPCYKDHDYKNMALKRPMSPHLTVYAMSIPASTSIMERITGIIVTGYALILTGGALFLPNGIESYVTMLQSLGLSGGTAFLIKFVLGLPFSYHYCNGIRFCAWNALRLFSLKEMNSTVYKTLMGSVIIAIIFAIF